MLEKDTNMSADNMCDKTVHDRQAVPVAADTQTVPTSVIEKGESLNCNLDTSIDCGIHDIVIKQEPIDDCDIQNTTDSNSVTSTVGNVEVKKEPLEDIEAAKDRDDKVITNTSTESKENSTSLKHDSDIVDKVNLTGKEASSSNESAEGLGAQEPVAVEETSTVSKCMNVEMKSAEDPSDSDAVIVVSTSNMMEYRTAEKVVTIDDDTSDSSPDSSDSETDPVHDKEKKAENTETQINKIISNEREVSPERDRRVKMNRHGFEDVRTKGELLPEDLPPLEELTITVDESVVMVEVGSIKSIVGILVVIQSNENVPALDDETILFVEGHKVLGQVFEVFGPVKTPWYSVRFNEVDNIGAKGLTVGMPVFCAPREKSFTKFVFVDSLKKVKGSDASWEDNNEPPEKHIEYSDDESERRAKAKRRNKKFGDNDGLEVEDGESSAQKKNPRNRNRNRQHSNDHQQSQPPRRAWNPFQGNQNDNNTNMPPRFGPRPQNNGRNCQPAGQRWPQAQFNRPHSHFGGPPNFQPRMSQPQGHQPLAGRNTPSSNTWRPPGSDYPKNQQNYEFVAQPLVNCPPQTGGSFNFQTPTPSVSTSSFGSNQGQSVQNCPPGPVNVDTSQPPPQFKFGNQVRPQTLGNDTNNWIQPPSSMNKQNAPFIPESKNLYVPFGNQSINNQLMNQENQMCNRGQSVNFTSYQGNQSTNADMRIQPNNNTSQMVRPNFSSPSSNTQQNPFNQPSLNNGNSSMPQAPTSKDFHPNFGFQQQCGGVQGQFQSNGNYQQNGTNNSQPDFMQVPMSGFVSQSGFTGGSDKGVIINGPNATGTSSNNMPSGLVNSAVYTVQQSAFNAQGHNVGNSQMQNISGHNSSNNIQNKPFSGNENFVQGHNFRNNAEQGFPQNNFQTAGAMNQFPPTQGFQGNFVHNQSAGHTGFNASSVKGFPRNTLTPVVNNVGYNQAGSNMQPGAVMDHRFIQNNT